MTRWRFPLNFIKNLSEFDLENRSNYCKAFLDKIGDTTFLAIGSSFCHFV